MAWKLAATSEPGYMAGFHVESNTISFEIRFFEYLMSKLGENAPIIIRSILAHEIAHYIDFLSKELTQNSIHGIITWEKNTFNRTNIPEKKAVDHKLTAAISHSEVDFIGYYLLKKLGYIVPEHLIESMMRYIYEYPMSLTEDEEVYLWVEEIWDFARYLRKQIPKLFK